MATEPLGGRVEEQEQSRPRRELDAAVEPLPLFDDRALTWLTDNGLGVLTYAGRVDDDAELVQLFAAHFSLRLRDDGAEPSTSRTVDLGWHRSCCYPQPLWREKEPS